MIPPDAVLDLWFGPPADPQRAERREIWFKPDPEFDSRLRDALARPCGAAAAGGLSEWSATAEGALARVILLDQIPRNIYRGTPRAYEADALARHAAEEAISRGFDRATPPAWRLFFYLPFEHSEDEADQARAVALVTNMPDYADKARTLRIAHRHAEIIARFGRFPHRNAILGRRSTPAELAFLKEPDSSF